MQLAELRKLREELEAQQEEQVRQATLQAKVQEQLARYEEQRIKLQVRLAYAQLRVSEWKRRAIRGESMFGRFRARAEEVQAEKEAEYADQWNSEIDELHVKARSTEQAHQEVVRQLIAQTGERDRSAQRWEQMYWDKGEPHRSKGGNNPVQ